MTGNLNWMSNLKSLDEPIAVKIGDSTELQAISIGDVHLLAHDGEKWNKIILRQVLFVPSLTFNLFSVTTVLDKGYTQQANAEKSIILENGKPVLIAERSGRQFLMKFLKDKAHNLSAVSVKVWHNRLAHQNIQYVKDILNNNNIKYLNDWNDSICEGCIYGKQCRTNHPTNPTKAKNCLDLFT